MLTCFAFYRLFYGKGSGCLVIKEHGSPLSRHIIAESGARGGWHVACSTRCTSAADVGCYFVCASQGSKRTARDRDVGLDAFLVDVCPCRRLVPGHSDGDARAV